MFLHSKGNQKQSKKTALGMGKIFENLMQCTQEIVRQSQQMRRWTFPLVLRGMRVETVTCFPWIKPDTLSLCCRIWGNWWSVSHSSFGGSNRADL